MSIHLLGGFAKNFTIKIPKNITYRPTLSLLKRRIFDRFQNLEGYDFYDLFAGSGSMGMEALSRGAGQVYFIEKNNKSFENLKMNLDRFCEAYSSEHNLQIESLCMDVNKFNFKGLLHGQEAIIYIDPPYGELESYRSLAKKLREYKKIITMIWVEGDKDKTCSAESLIEQCSLSEFGEINKIYEQGSHYLICIENI
ncbi:MAG: RsmD family RNA methyltransferase [Halobacteriovoraceae bacterium]|nr:RsmD family RNA methyltransferase [Halobacteriovoraceae bacterium]MCB9094092.1 RsmD family RNA methyltransferase [Halobacteriovoraceae bacterium]